MFCYFRSFLGTRLLGRFAPIFLFKLWTCSFCLHFKTKKKKISRIFQKTFLHFQNYWFFFVDSNLFVFVHFYLFLSLIIFNTLHFSAMFVFVWFIPRRPKVTYLELFHQNLIIGKHIFTRPPFLFKILFYPDGPGE